MNVQQKKKTQNLVDFQFVVFNFFQGNIVTSSKTELRKNQSGKRTKRKPRVLFSQVRNGQFFNFLIC